MNTIAGRAEEACAGAAGWREHPASGKRRSKAAALYMRDLRKRIVSPSAKKYTRTAQGMRLRQSRHRRYAGKINDCAGEKLLSGPASRTNQFLPHMLEAALRGCYPMMVGVRRVVPNMFRMPTFQVRHPGAVCIHAKTDNLARNPGRLGFHGLHSPILRAFLRPSSYFPWPRRLRQQPLLEVLHSVCYINNEPLEGAQNMEAGNETAAAILVQTIFLKDGHLQGL